MLKRLARNWWLVALRGVAALLFGILALVWPELSLSVLVAFFGIYAIADGAFSLVSELRRFGERARWWVLLLEGVAGIGFGVVAILTPRLTAILLLYLIAGWALMTGFFELAAALRLRQEIQGEWTLIGMGGVSISFGVLLLLFPAAGALALISLIGAFSILFGILLIAFSLRLKGWQEVVFRAAPEEAGPSKGSTGREAKLRK